MELDLSFNLPFCLLLPDGEYPVRLSDGKTVQLQLEMKIPEIYDEKMGIRGLTQKDLEGVSSVRIFITENEYSGDRGPVIPVEKIWDLKEVASISVFYYTDGREVAPRTPVYINTEIPKDTSGRFRYTKLTIVDESGDPKKSAILGINRLIDYYRLLTREYWIQHLAEKDVIAYTSRDGSGGYGPTSKHRRLHDGDTVRRLKEKLINTKSPFTFEILELDARAAIDRENYALAVIYSMTSLESLVKTFLPFYASRMAHVSKTLESMESISLFYLVSVVLRIAFTRGELSDDLIEEFRRINRLRNDIIHKALIDVTPDDANKAVKLVGAFREILYPEIIAGQIVSNESYANLKD